MWKTLIVEYQSEEEAKALRADWRPIGFLSRDEPGPPTSVSVLGPDGFYEQSRPGPSKQVFYVLLGKETKPEETPKARAEAAKLVEEQLQKAFEDSENEK